MTQTHLQKNYDSFLESEAAAHWEKIGLKRRAGVAVSLFSLYSNKSVGIGEFHDLKLLVDWCSESDLTIIQLLPMNDTGFDFRPYDAQSAFALEPVYLSLHNLKGIKSIQPYQKEIAVLHKEFSLRRKHYVNYEIKKAKLALLRKIFTDQKSFPEAFNSFIQDQSYWLEGYVQFRVVSDHFTHSAWEYWPEPFHHPDSQAVKHLLSEQSDSLQFYRWIQWQCFEALAEIKEYAAQKGVLMLGDMPFLTSRNSSDVWTYQRYFKLNLESGAPPDSDNAKGQRWGMPAYNWSAIEHDRFQYLSKKLKYAENFYHLYRIDHIVGAYRLWVIRREEDRVHEGSVGSFDPPNEMIWEEHGYKLLRQMLASTPMLPCGEDLGTVPHFSGEVLRRLGIPGMNVQRWNRDWGGALDFLSPDSYRKNSVAVISTHDTSSLMGWWKCECGTVHAQVFERTCKNIGIDFESMLPKLFDVERTNPKYGRLIWKSEIDSVEKFLHVVGGDKDISQLVFLFRASLWEKQQFLDFLGLKPTHLHEISDVHVYEAALKKSLEASSIFSIQLLQDWLALDIHIEVDPWDFRINFPGTVSSRNWAIILPLSLEALKAEKLNIKIRSLIQHSHRK